MTASAAATVGGEDFALKGFVCSRVLRIRPRSLCGSNSEYQHAKCHGCLQSWWCLYVWGGFVACLCVCYAHSGSISHNLIGLSNPRIFVELYLSRWLCHEYEQSLILFLIRFCDSTACRMVIAGWIPKNCSTSTLTYVWKLARKRTGQPVKT